MIPAALAIFFGVSGGLTSIGPIAGGYLVQWTWRAIFWINVPVAIAAVVVTLLAGIKEQPARERIDIPGAVLVAAGMALSVLGLQQAPTWGWSSGRTWGCIIGGFVLLVVFAVVEMRTRIPLIKVRIFAERAFLVDNIVLFLSMIAFVPVFFFASVYAQLSLGYDASQAGLYLLTFFAGFAPAAQIGGRMLDSGGARRPVIIGCALSVVGFALWGWSVPDLRFGNQWYWVVLAGAGIGMLLGPVSTDATNRAINASYGEVTGITQTVRNYGSTLGIAVLSTVLSHVLVGRLTDSFVTLGLPREQAAGYATSASNFSGGSRSDALNQVPEFLRSGVLYIIRHDFGYATRIVFYGMAVALALALVAAVLHPGTRVMDPTQERAGADRPTGPTDS